MPESLCQSGKCPDLLGAATAVNAVSSLICVQGFRTFGLQVVLSGSPTAVVKILGSNDGVTLTATELGKWDSGSQSAGDIIWVVDKPVQFIELKLTTFSGGTAPTAKAYLSGV